MSYKEEFRLEVQRMYDEYLYKTEKRGISYGEIAYIESLAEVALQEFYDELCAELYEEDEEEEEVKDMTMICNNKEKTINGLTLEEYETLISALRVYEETFYTGKGKKWQNMVNKLENKLNLLITRCEEEFKEKESE